jgi:hypothetical protein
MASRIVQVLCAATTLCLTSLGAAESAPRLDSADSAKPETRAAKTEITFSGFQTFPDGTSRLFVRLTGKPELTRDTAQSTVTYLLKQTFVGIRNNKNPLDLRHFQSPLLRAQLVEQGADVLLVLRLRHNAKDVRLQHRFSKRNDGSYSLQIDLPAASSVPPAG